MVTISVDVTLDGGRQQQDRAVPAPGQASLNSGSIPLGLYLHLPWCLRKCPYCDFNSHELRGELPAAAYQRALLNDLDFACSAVAPRRFATVYFGGGTPSLYPPELIAEILDHLRRRQWLLSDAEITVEANPGAADQSRFRALRDAGVNRLSVGVQSFNDRSLAALGRVHDAAAARSAVATALTLFADVNIDLMHGLPGQSVADARADVQAAVDFAPAHISCYQLTIEQNTVFYSRPPPLPPDDELARIEDTVLEVLAAAAYRRYEISAYARAGRYCRHNLNYWQFGDYLGIGAGAHSKLSTADGVRREARLRLPASYQRYAGSAAAVGEWRSLAPGECRFEFMLNALRLTEGFSQALFEERTGLPLDSAEQDLRRCEQRGWLQRDAAGIRTTPSGRRWLNRVLQEFLPGPV